MKKILTLIFSTRTTLVLLIIFAAAIGAATFIEQTYDTVTAQLLVYHAKWFEIVILLLALNFIGNIKTYHLLSKGKLAGFTFHFAFLLLILGAAVTRYTGFEGSIHIRENKSSNIMYSSEPYLQVSAISKGDTVSTEKQLSFSEALGNSFHISLDTKGPDKIEIRYKDYFNNGVEQLHENIPGGVDMLELVVGSKNGRKTILLKNGEIQKAGNGLIAFNNNSNARAVKIFSKDGNLFLSSPSSILKTYMHTASDSTQQETQADSIAEFKTGFLYNTGGELIIFSNFYKSAVQEWSRSTNGEEGSEVLMADVTYKGKTQSVAVVNNSGFETSYSEVDFEGMKLNIAYGKKAIELPFSLFLNDFVLERYPGSTSPSSYSSDVTLTDTRNAKEIKYKIYMNHILDYDGYRFFQSSYDTDEGGTILSVNHDFWGTWISYLGYILLGVGFVLTLFNKNSRFQFLRKQIRKVRDDRRAGIAVMIALFLVIGSGLSAQNDIPKAVDAAQADKFGHLVVQTFDGRFQPMHTLAYDVMHKISRKDQFETNEKGTLDGTQVFMDMLLDPEFWRNQKMIYVREKSVQDILGIDGSYARFYDFLDAQSQYKLQQYVETAFRKRPADQNSFDKEIIRVDERINVFMTVLSGSMLKVFPLQDANNTWISFTDSLALTPLQGNILKSSEVLKLDAYNYNNVMRYYLTKVFEAVRSGNYAPADEALAVISAIQTVETPSGLLPTARAVNLEIFYNKAHIFESLRNWYSMLSVILLTLAFIDNLRTKKSKVISLLFNFFIVILGLAFAYHTFGLGLRWYLSDHAPWSNGYEALLLVGWGAILAGFYFRSYSKITLAATVLLASSILMTAGHSSYDPQLTNLQPVLKSYWLIVHVAVITLSYGFLALGFMLGLINLVITLFKTKKSYLKLDLIIKELTFTNEMALTVGIFLATLGTFLGGVWANESWGRYWGWDAKETWALVIIIIYAFILHLRLVPGLKSSYIFNVASVVGFGSVIMTFVGVNYYLSKGMHSYASGDTAVFPIWAWGMILSLILLIIAAGFKEKSTKKIQS